MVDFMGNTLRGKVGRENCDKLIASRQNLSEFCPVKALRYTAAVYIAKFLNLFEYHHNYTNTTYIIKSGYYAHLVIKCILLVKRMYISRF